MNRQREVRSTCATIRSRDDPCVIEGITVHANTSVLRNPESRVPITKRGRNADSLYVNVYCCKSDLARGNSLFKIIIE